MAKSFYDLLNNHGTNWRPRKTINSELSKLIKALENYKTTMKFNNESELNRDLINYLQSKNFSAHYGELGADIAVGKQIAIELKFFGVRPGNLDNLEKHITRYTQKDFYKYIIIFVFDQLGSWKQQINRRIEGIKQSPLFKNIQITHIYLSPSAQPIVSNSIAPKRNRKPTRSLTPLEKLDDISWLGNYKPPK